MSSADVQPELAIKSFHWLDFDAYLFDIDGTLLLTRDGVHRKALHTAMREIYGIDTNIEGIAYHGMTDLGILREALARMGVSSDVFEGKLPAALDVVCREVEVNAAKIVPEICPGVPGVLAKLHGMGKLLGVASGNLKSVGWHKITAARLNHFFTFGCFSDRSEQRADVFRNAVEEAKRRRGDDATVCFLGDTPSDIAAAHAVGAAVIAVSTGIFGHEELGKYHPDANIGSCEELLRSS